MIDRIAAQVMAIRFTAYQPIAEGRPAPACDPPRRLKRVGESRPTRAASDLR